MGAPKDLIRLTCGKIMKGERIPEFNRLHERAILCFSRHRRLNLYEAVILMDENKSKTQKVLEDLTKLNILKYRPPDYRMKDPFEALFTLVAISEKKKG